MSLTRGVPVVLSLIPLCLAFAIFPVLAQNENETVGFQANHVFESGQFGEDVDILNGGLTLTIPIGPRYQVSQHLGYQLNLMYGDVPLSVES